MESNGEEDLNESAVYPRIQITIKKLESNNRLIVTLHRAENLPKIGDKNPDPFVKIYKIPDKTSRTMRENKIKSETKRNTCNPVFNESFELESECEAPNGLEIVVYSRNGSSHIPMFKKKNTTLGLATVEFHDLGLSQQITEWYDLEQISD